MWGPDEWSSLSQGATAAIAGGAAWYARRQVGEARQLREAQAQPFVVVSIEQSPVVSRYVCLVIENIGATLARDVKVSFDPPLKAALSRRDRDHASLEGSALLERGIATMPPGMRLERIFDDAAMRQKEGDLPWAYDVTVSFDDHKGKPQDPLRYPIDMEPLRSGSYFDEMGLHQVAKSLDEIRGLLKSWSEFPKGLKVYSRSGDDKDARNAELAREVRELRQQERLAADGRDDE